MAFPLRFQAGSYTVFSLSKNGEVKEIDARYQQLFEGKFFHGQAEYTGNLISVVNQIAGAWMFITAKEFLNQIGSHRADLTSLEAKQADLLLSSLDELNECYVIAFRRD